MSAQKDCNIRCQSYKAGEVKHWHECKYYPGSFSEKYDQLRDRVKLGESAMAKAYAWPNDRSPCADHVTFCLSKYREKYPEALR